VSVGDPIGYKIHEGLGFDRVSSDELDSEVVDFCCPFADVPYGFRVLEDVVEWEAQRYNNFVSLEIVFQLSGRHDNYICDLLHFSVEFFSAVEGLGYIIY
jgi:hypothetical protein